MLWHLVRSHAFVDLVDEATIAATVRAYRVGWATYAAATIVALIWPVASFALYIMIALYYLVPRGIDADLSRSGD